MCPNRTTCFLPQEQFDVIKSQYANFNEPWRPDEIEELKAMSSDGVSIKDMASQLQRTPNSIKMKLKALGLYVPPAPSKTWSEDDEKRLITMYNDGIPFESIGKELGRTEKAVVSRLVHLRMNLFQTI